MPKVKVFVRPASMYPIRKPPNIEIRAGSGEVYVNGEHWNQSRVGTAIMNFTRFCLCGHCDSCLVGKMFLKK